MRGRAVSDSRCSAHGVGEQTKASSSAALLSQRVLPGSAACGCSLGATDPVDEQGSNQRPGDKPCPFTFHSFAIH